MKTPGLNWATLPSEQDLVFPCDSLLESSEEPAFRAVTVNASPAVLFRRLCQLRVAPYSYDWIDNGGRRSPAALTPGVEKLALGQEVMTIFELAGFEPGVHLTLTLSKPSARRLFGELAVSYLIRATDHPERSRLLGKLVFRYPRGPWGWFLRVALPAGDWVMMRRQFLNLKHLAECDAGAA